MGEREQEIQKRWNRTTRGLWVVFVEGSERSIVAANEARFVCHLNDNMRLYQEDAEFIAAAHQDVPWLLEQLAAERAARAADQQTAQRLRNGVATLVGEFTSGVYCANCGESLDDGCTCPVGRLRALLAPPVAGPRQCSQCTAAALPDDDWCSSCRAGVQRAHEQLNEPP